MFLTESCVNGERIYSLLKFECRSPKKRPRPSQLTESELIKAEQDAEILSAAAAAREEQHDDVKHMNQVGVSVLLILE